MVQKNIRVRESLWTRVEAVVGPRKVSDFIRDAVEEKLKPIETELRLKQHEERLQALEGRR